jgi:hypothetical protein
MAPNKKLPPAVASNSLVSRRSLLAALALSEVTFHSVAFAQAFEPNPIFIGVTLLVVDGFFRAPFDVSPYVDREEVRSRAVAYLSDKLGKLNTPIRCVLRDDYADDGSSARSLKVTFVCNLALWPNEQEKRTLIGSVGLWLLRGELELGAAEMALELFESPPDFESASEQLGIAAQRQLDRLVENLRKHEELR